MIKSLNDKLSVDDCLNIGFEKLPHFTVADNLIYKLGRNRHLSIGCLGTPNETLFICESDPSDYRKITDVICLHNFDYDGYLTKSKLETLITCLGFHSSDTELKKITQHICYFENNYLYL